MTDFLDPLNQYNLLPSPNNYARITFPANSMIYLLWSQQNRTNNLNQYYLATTTDLVPQTTAPTSLAVVYLPTVTLVSAGTQLRINNPTSSDINLMTYDGALLVSMPPNSMFWVQTTSSEVSGPSETSAWRVDEAGASTNVNDIVNNLGNGLINLPTSSTDKLTTALPAFEIINKLTPVNPPAPYVYTFAASDAWQIQGSLLYTTKGFANQITIQLPLSSSLASTNQFFVAFNNLGNAPIVLQTINNGDRINGVQNPANPLGYSTQIIDVGESAWLVATSTSGWMVINRSKTYQPLFRETTVNLSVAPVQPYGSGSNVGYIDLSKNFDSIYSSIINIVGSYPGATNIPPTYQLIYLVLPNYFGNLYNIISNFILPPGTNLNSFGISIAVGTNTNLPYDPLTNPFAYTWDEQIVSNPNANFAGNLIAYSAKGSLFNIGYLVTTDVNDVISQLTFLDGSAANVNITTTGLNNPASGMYFFGNSSSQGFGFSVNGSSIFEVISTANGVEINTTGSLNQISFTDFLNFS